MNKLLLGVLLGASTGAAMPFAQALPRAHVCATRHTVLQYFDLVPDEFFLDPPVRHRLLDKKHSPDAVVDIAHDFLQCSDANGDIRLALAVFRHRGKELLAVSFSNELGYLLRFYKLRGGQLVDVTSQYPRVPREPFPYEFGEGQQTQHAILPRTGTTIRVEDDNGEKKRYLYSLAWRGGRFVKTR